MIMCVNSNPTITKLDIRRCSFPPEIEEAREVCAAQTVRVLSVRLGLIMVHKKKAGRVRPSAASFQFCSSPAALVELGCLTPVAAVRC